MISQNNRGKSLKIQVVRLRSREKVIWLEWVKGPFVRIRMAFNLDCSLLIIFVWVGMGEWVWMGKWFEQFDLPFVSEKAVIGSAYIPFYIIFSSLVKTPRQNICLKYLFAHINTFLFNKLLLSLYITLSFAISTVSAGMYKRIKHYLQWFGQDWCRTLIKWKQHSLFTCVPITPDHG